MTEITHCVSLAQILRYFMNSKGSRIIGKARHVVSKCCSANTFIVIDAWMLWVDSR